MGFLNKLFGVKEKESLDQGLQKTKEGFFAKINRAIAGKSEVDEEVLDNLEEALVGADVGIETTISIIKKVEEFKNLSGKLNLEIEDSVKNRISKFNAAYISLKLTQLPQQNINLFRSILA